MNIEFKRQVYQTCELEIANKIAHLQQGLKDLKISAANETKSTAGDKYETALAMLQIEQANVNKQLQIFKDQQLALQKINPAHHVSVVGLGSLVCTDAGYFFLSVAVGKIEVDGVTVYAISPISPLGAKLLRLQKNDTVSVNNRAYCILNVG